MRYWFAVAAVIIAGLTAITILSVVDTTRKRMLSSYCKNVEQGLIEDFEGKCPKPIALEKLR